MVYGEEVVKFVGKSVIPSANHDYVSLHWNICKAHISACKAYELGIVYGCRKVCV
jgi:hypothetical protein